MKEKIKVNQLFQRVFKRKALVIFVVAFIVVGAVILTNIFAETPNASFEAENIATLTGQAVKCPPATDPADSTASGGRYIILNQSTCNNTTPPSSACKDRTPQITLTGSQSTAYRPKTTTALPTGSGINATGASWTSAAVGSYPVYFESGAGSNICFYGGNISGSWNEATEPWDTYHGAYAIQVHSPNNTFDGVRINNYGDGIGFGDGNSADWTIRNTWISHSHDDCVENDYMHNGLIEDSLLESCFSIISARGHSGQTVKPDGRSKTWTIRNTLMGIYAVDQPYKPSSYESPGHGGLFKWSSIDGTEGYGTKIALSNVIIKLDGRKPNHQDYNIPLYKDSSGNDVPYVTSCSNVKIVWGGELRNGVPYFTQGSAAGTSAASQFSTWAKYFPNCMTMTTDQTVWTNAVASWKAAHPGVK